MIRKEALFAEFAGTIGKDLTLGLTLGFAGQIGRCAGAKRPNNVHVKNAGISDDTTSHVLKRVDSAIPDGTKIVILAMGGGFSTTAKPTFRPHRDKLI